MGGVPLSAGAVPGNYASGTTVLTRLPLVAVGSAMEFKSTDCVSAFLKGEYFGSQFVDAEA